MKYRDIAIWDSPTRLFHWSLVTCFAVSFSSGLADKFDGDDVIHQRSGVIILSLLVWRILWGFIGSDPSRFKQFVAGPARVLSYIKEVRQGRSPIPLTHNPLGGWSVMLVLILLLTQGVIGLFATDGMFFSGPLSHVATGGWSGILTGLHRDLGWAMLGLIGLHVSAVLIYTLSGHDLVSAMVTGKKGLPADKAPHDTPVMRSPLLGFALMALCVAGGLWRFG